MNFPQLKMESTFGQLGLNIQKPVQEIEQPAAEISIQQPKAELEMETTPGKLTIDQTQAWEDMDLKHIFKRIEDFAQNGYQDWLAGMGRRASEGDDLMRIENGGIPIADHAKINGESPIYEFNIGFVPSHFSVKTNYQPGDLKINWKANKPEIDVQVNKPRHDYTPGVIRGEMKQWPSLKIEVIGLEVDEKK
ncbi:DUF6470 family protein [Fictibacillus barbaricus]|uniref:Uncharacterized protein n=1 Tax=Fictibacillus barbaricus TaxID=182136 RepID=A0ABS2ZJH7_9BACL|nr:DUF6470 family protein [Fictibacillus barbaricus]MBN3546769.1 hypothetical protein [Fictibacillus barbaricus]GGB43688.1 hypothetical protein GCM10007199_06280 [Fictibacillus barbaricus]